MICWHTLAFDLLLYQATSGVTASSHFYVIYEKPSLYSQHIFQGMRITSSIYMLYVTGVPCIYTCDMQHIW